MGKLLNSGGDRFVHAHWTWSRRASFNFVRYQRVFEAVIESAAIYSFASLALLITSFVSPNIGYTVCFYLFSPLIVSRLVCFIGLLGM